MSIKDEQQARLTALPGGVLYGQVTETTDTENRDNVARAGAAMP